MTHSAWTAGAWIRVFLAGLLGLSAQAAYAAAPLGGYDAPMTFALAGNGGNCAGCEWISAMGVIGPETPDKLRAFLAGSRNLGRPTIFFHSPGGTLVAGLKLGEMIRRAHLNTNVGETFETAPWDDTRFGICASACAYAFLGGENRTIDAGSKLGFHQFYKDPAAREIDAASAGLERLGLSTDQVIEGVLAAYLVEMGVDARLLTVAAGSGRADVAVLSDADMKQYDILSKTGWGDMAMRPAGSGLVATAERLDTTTDERAVTFYCKGSQPYLALALDRPADGSTPLTRADFVSAIQKAAIAVDKAAYDVSPADLVLAYGTKAYVMSLPVPAAAVAQIPSAVKISVSTDAPHAFFDFGPNAEISLTADDRQMIGLAFRNCL